METFLVKQASFDKLNQKNILKELIDDIKINLEIKVSAINTILQSLKEENEQIITKCKMLIFHFFIIFYFSVFNM